MRYTTAKPSKAAFSTVFKRNANAFSLNAIVDVRLRHRHFIRNILEATRASNVEICLSIALDCSYISTGNDVITSFRLAANRINPVHFGSRSGRDFSITVQLIPK